MRLLATSDLHMQVTTFDYARDRAGSGGSLAKLATLIRAARAEARTMGAACVLFDNGDTLQGTPLADHAARAAPASAHPMITCLNALQYDACGLGNHDFDYGVGRLAAWVDQYQMPVICSNLDTDALPAVHRSLLHTCEAITEGGQSASLRLGILSVVPDKTAAWNRHQLQSRARFNRPLPVIAREAAHLRAKGADLVVVLAHMGLAVFDEGEAAQNQLEDIARLDDVDAIVGGHTHRRFPGPDHLAVQSADCTRGTILGKPAIQPGASGSDLGLIDLDLEWADSAGWQISRSRVRLQPVTAATLEDPEITRLCAPAHRQMRRFLGKPVTTIRKPMNSYFALAQPSPLPALLAAAKRAAVAERVSGTPHANLPLVSIASTPMTGGFDGPENFLDIQAGKLYRHHVAGMNRFTNHLRAIRATGAQLIDWLERSAVIFNTLLPDLADQPLVDTRVPGFRYDAAYGLTYEIDPRKPALYDPGGRKITGRTGRIGDVRWQGRPVTAEQVFVVATTDHRVTGGGIYASVDEADILIEEHRSLQEIVLDYLQNTAHHEAFRDMRPWSFVSDMNRAAMLLTAPGARGHLEEIAHFAPEVCGESSDGFLRVRLHL